ncbi:MAG: HTH domain-containing protein [Chloroflexi bacterium]|nr:HTH domain-containing protein [Chloroflexota bacterium]
MPYVRAGVRDADYAGVTVAGHICRAVRLIEMMRLLRDRPLSSAELAERFGVSQRMVQYDLMDLQSWPMYVPLARDLQGRWYIPRGWRLL